MQLSNTQLAITADWLPTFGGAEHVLLELHTLWPQAPIFTTVLNRKKIGPLGEADIRVSWLQHLYRLTGNHQILLALMPRVMEDMDLRGYDIVLSSSHAVGKGIVPPAGAVHICYCHTPMRYAWDMEEKYLKDFRVPAPLRPLIRVLLERLRRWDLTTAKRVDHFIANSTTTQERIERIYGRKSTVIHPPVSDMFLQTPLVPSDEREAYFLAVGRLVPYKRFDLLVEAANRLRLPLKIAGEGREFARLKAMAGPTVQLLGYVPTADLPGLYGKAKALLFPQHEDAGVVALEAQACGTPVIAYGLGGSLDTVRDGVTGIFFAEQTSRSLEDALHRFAQGTRNTQVIRTHATQYSAALFRERIQTFVQSVQSGHEAKHNVA